LISVILFQCYPAKALFESFSVDSDGLNPEKFEKICPALVEQIESKACVLDQEEEGKEDATQSKAQGLYPLQTRHPSLVILASLRYSAHFLVSEPDCPNDFLDIKEETNILVILLNFYMYGSICPIFYGWSSFLVVQLLLIRVHTSQKIGNDNESLPYGYCNFQPFTCMTEITAPVDFFQKELNNQGANLCNPLKFYLFILPLNIACSFFHC